MTESFGMQLDDDSLLALFSRVRLAHCLNLIGHVGTANFTQPKTPLTRPKPISCGLCHGVRCCPLSVLQ